MGLGSLGKFLTGSGGKTQQLPAISAEQNQVLNHILSLLGMDPSALDVGGNPLYQQGQDVLMGLLGGDTSALEAPLMRQYENEILPQIAQRFGALGAQSSSGYQNALANAGGNLSAQLGQLRAQSRDSALDKALGYSGQRASGLQNLAGLGLNVKPFGYQTSAPKMGLFDALGYGAGSSLGSGIGSKLSGLFG